MEIEGEDAETQCFSAIFFESILFRSRSSIWLFDLKILIEMKTLLKHYATDFMSLTWTKLQCFL